MGGFDRELRFFVDEFQVLTNDAIIARMGRLLERLPSRVTLYIRIAKLAGTRSRPLAVT
ncbi:MAG: hypothetical protein QF609_11905 [Gammaproteobacteria bacterium]|nr:hypothetical protein [Gammaproteobacteria bacterium]